MRFKSVQVLNFKSFRDSGEIPLTPGFNVIVGKNDAGKSALLEAISLQEQHKPHRSLLTMPNTETVIDPVSVTQYTVEISPEELKIILSPHQRFYLRRDHADDGKLAFERLKDAIDKVCEFIGYSASAQITRGDLKGGSSDPNSQWIEIYNRISPCGFEPCLQGIAQYDETMSSFGEIVGKALLKRIYTFRAERLNIGECTVTGTSLLASNASNLAEVLNLLISSNPARYQKLLNYVKTVFPHITQITAPFFANNVARVMVWGVAAESERQDLAVPLSESGTGLGQVLAILYIVVTSDTPKVIIIDEPHSFLHPGAARKLLEILRDHPQHQYVITTHSPTAIAATGVESLIQVRRNGHESVVDIISAKQQSDLKLFLADVGASLSDVFVADKILWVEGKTEEICFPIIIRKLIRNPLFGIQILGVQHTGDLEGKLASRIFDIYDRLTSAHTLLPPAIAFILDQEDKSEKQRQEIDEKSKEKVRWLPRRMYENYLLDPECIASVLNIDDTQRDHDFAVAEIEKWISEHASNPKYFNRLSNAPKYPSSEWEQKVDAAKLLADLFGESTEQRVTYEKVQHGPMLTELLIEKKTNAIQELSDFLNSVMALKIDDGT